MNRQQIFDAAVGALIKQGKPSFDAENGSCLYRGPNGAKCAVGHLIPDEQYREELEGKRVYDARVARAAGIAPSSSEVGLLAELQEAHDETADALGAGRYWLPAFCGRAAGIARRNGLKTTVVDDYEAASGTEARSGETACGLDPKDDGPVGEAETPKNPTEDER